MASRVGLLGAAFLLILAPATTAAQERVPRRPATPQDTVSRPPGAEGGPVLLPSPGPSRQRTCRQVLPSDARRLFNAWGQELIYFQDPVRMLCTGGLRLEADSAVMNRTQGTVELVGDVVYRDSLRELTAGWANYLGHRDQLLAREGVVLRNVETGSLVEGEELNYLQATEQRPVARMLVRGGRPHAVIPPRPDSAGGVTETAVSTEIWADGMEFEGEEIFRGRGNVEIERGEMTGAGRTAVFDQREERMTLTDDAFVQTDRYRLEGDQIVAFLSGEELRYVTADGSAVATSQELAVESDRVRIGFVNGRLDRLEAWNPRGDSVPRVLADARDFRLRADSIDAHADSIGVQEVRAVGRAYGERNAMETERFATAVSRDWIQGDTIRGFFTRQPVSAAAAPPGRVTPPPGRVTPPPERVTPLPPAQGPPAERRAPAGDTLPGLAERGALAVLRDSAATGVVEGSQAATDSVETVLERIVVIGGRAPALSLYRMPADEEGREPSINFLKANRITLFMANGDVTRVDAEGPLDGVYLAPGGRAAAPEEPSDGTPEGGGAEAVEGEALEDETVEGQAGEGETVETGAEEVGEGPGSAGSDGGHAPSGPGGDR